LRSPKNRRGPQTGLKTSGALRGFFRIVDAWCLDSTQQATLLGTRRRTIDRWKANAGEAKLTRNQIERLSQVLGIYGSLHAVLGDSSFANDWVRLPNADFGDTAPLERMLAEGADGLSDVRQYLETWLAGVEPPAR
jgi:uncharacterized protein (DUF2384 family)